MKTAQLQEIHEVLDEAIKAAENDLMRKLLYCEDEEIPEIRAQANAMATVRGKVLAEVNQHD